MRIDYPIDGINKSNKEYIDSTISSLNDARNKCNFSIPSGFKYVGFLNNLRNTLSDYQKEATSIKNIVSSIDYQYENLEQEFIDEINAIDRLTVKERDRMIY